MDGSIKVTIGLGCKRRIGVLLHVTTQAMQRPATFKAKMFHFSPSVLRRQTFEVDFVKSGDQAGSVAADAAVKINGPKAFIGKQTERLAHV